MNSSKRLKPIKKLADNKQKAAAQTLGKSMEMRKFQIQKLNQLVSYRAEYVNSMALKTQQGMSGDQLQQYHQFLTKLDTAIDHQKVVVSESEQQMSQNQDQWRSKNSRANAIGKAIDQLKQKEVKASDKKEATQIDELSAQAFLRGKLR